MQALQNIEQFTKGVKMDKWAVALVTGATCVVGSVVMLVKKISSHRETEEKIKRARNKREESLQRAEQAVLRYKESHPTTDSAFILTLSLSELTQQLKEGSLTPEDVLYSYMEKTLAVNKKLNCCTEILLESLDQLTTVGSNKDGLLYGVPVSVKENITFKNHDCSCGVVINLDQPAEKDSVLVQVLKKHVVVDLRLFLVFLPALVLFVELGEKVPELWKQHAAVEDYIQETIAHWRSCNIDVLLCPVIGPAYNFLYCGKLSTAASYTMLYNLLTFPAGVVTVSTVTTKDEEELKHYKGCYQDMWDKLFKEAVTGGEGLPVAVQCVALPWQDELCLRLMKEVEQLVKESKK
ncbi:uncharacterized protein LOC106632720 [Haplochromis burtoni]|uniref:uncharacterized protein LOC106632720 n=1 Tax=Haplochromis burtoni TaxID=8153 RepID=UPI001C2D2A60|nr:uncharacterized protein LOC106632720 [Haplochromis burtoni]